MAERVSAAELRSYGLRGFLLDQYDRVMGVETRIQLDLARRVTTTTSVGSVIGGVATGGGLRPARAAAPRRADPARRPRRPA